jgi:hypothetical protein
MNKKVIEMFFLMMLFLGIILGQSFYYGYRTEKLTHTISELTNAIPAETYIYTSDPNTKIKMLDIDGKEIPTIIVKGEK